MYDDDMNNFEIQRDKNYDSDLTVTHREGELMKTMATNTERWVDDSIQFPRLLCEIVATQDVDFEMLAEAMDLDIEDVEDLFERAHVAWENIKEDGMERMTEQTNEGQDVWILNLLNDEETYTDAHNSQIVAVAKEGDDAAEDIEARIDAEDFAQVVTFEVDDGMLIVCIHDSSRVRVVQGTSHESG